MVEAPPNICTPTHMAAAAAHIAALAPGTMKVRRGGGLLLHSLACHVMNCAKKGWAAELGC